MIFCCLLPVTTHYRPLGLNLGPIPVTLTSVRIITYTTPTGMRPKSLAGPGHASKCQQAHELPGRILPSVGEYPRVSAYTLKPFLGSLWVTNPTR
jgi:hypothetical protein